MYYEHLTQIETALISLKLNWITKSTISEVHADSLFIPLGASLPERRQVPKSVALPVSLGEEEVNGTGNECRMDCAGASNIWQPLLMESITQSVRWVDNKGLPCNQAVENEWAAGHLPGGRGAREGAGCRAW